jgi:tyrosine-protein phosphatase non-receptor type 1
LEHLIDNSPRRYRDVNPYDHSRICLKRQNIDYINANLVKLDRAKRQYILCQGPLEHTVGHFWLMAWEQQSKAILMLNKIIEKKQIKCHPYWPKNQGEKLELNDVGLTVEFLTAENYKNFSKRLFKITDMESTKSREVIQFHYTQVCVCMSHFLRHENSYTLIFSGRILECRVRQLRFYSS